MRNDRSYEDLLAAVFEKAGWQVVQTDREAKDDCRPELVVRRKGRAYAVEVRVWKGKPWKAALRGLLADGVLQARTRAAGQERMAPLVVVTASRISEAMAADLARYRDTYAPDVAWGLADDHGRLEFHGSGLASLTREARSATPRYVSRGGARSQRRELPSPFSDLGQWSLKVLLAPEIPSGLLAAPRRPSGEGSSEEVVAPVRGVRDLARRAGVSEPRASDILAALRRQGHIERRKDKIEIVRRASLFEAWRAAGSEAAEEFGVRFALRAKDARGRAKQLLRSWSKKTSGDERAPRVAMGLFAAASELGVGVVRGAPTHVLVEDASVGFLDELGLYRVDEHESPSLLVRRPRFVESAFRGRLVVEGVPVADILQVWLDVSAHASRGREQAEEILSYLGLGERA